MKTLLSAFLCVMILQPVSAQLSQQPKKNMICDIKTGACGPDDSTSKDIEIIDLEEAQKVKLIYYTDPICSACWAIEPQLRKLKAAYGHEVEVEYRMGGLLQKWEGFADRANGISKPQDVAGHWDEVGQESGMSIDGDVWIKDPLSSSYPASVAYYAVAYQGKDLALKYLRRLREMVFLEQVNIAKEENLVKAASETGVNVEQFKKDYHDSTRATLLFEQSMADRSRYGVRGFPTFILINEQGQGLRMSGMQPFEQYVSALEQAKGKPVTARGYDKDIPAILKKYGKLSTREIATLLDQTDEVTLAQLQKLTADKKLKEHKEKFGSFWTI